MFEIYSPQTLRSAIERELQNNPNLDAKAAAMIAMKRLNDNPLWYDMNKARDTSKLTKKVVTDKKGVRRTVYVKLHDDEKKNDSWLNTVMSFFGFSDKKQVFQKLDRDYKEHDIGRKFNLTWDGWKAHVGEYFANKQKWDNFFSGKKIEKKGTEKKEKKEKAEKDKKKKASGLRLSVMKEIFALYGGAKPVTGQDAGQVTGQVEQKKDNFDTMPESESKKNGNIKEKLERWKKGDLSGIIGEKFVFFNDLENIPYQTTVTVEKIGNTMVTIVEQNGSSLGLGEYFFKQGLNNNKLIPVELYSEPKTIKTGNGSKIETNVKITPKQEKETIDNDQIEAREGYFNEKPSEILNVGQDVWGAARHNFDTYEKFNVNIDDMEKDGTAVAYVSKKNIIGKYGLSDEDTKRRVENGETESKVLASFAVREYLSKMPADTPESRQKYMDFSRSVIRLDNETNNAKDFISGLSQQMQILFNVDMENKQSVKNCIDTIGNTLFGFMNIINNPGSVKARAHAQYGVDSKDRKNISNLTDIMFLELSGQKSYEKIKVGMFGATKAAGVKIKKGDYIVLNEDLKNAIYSIQTTYASEQDEKEAKEAREKYYKIEYDLPNISDYFDRMPDEDKKKRLKPIEDYFGRTFNSFAEYNSFKTKIVEDLKNTIESKTIRTKIYPEESGQVIKAGKDRVEVAFRFPNGKTKVFKLNPSEISQESIENIKKEQEKTPTGKVNFYIEAHVSRKGGKDYKEIPVQDAQKILKDEFGFKAIQYGNSMPEDERQYHTKWTLESFSDLSEILDLPIQQVTVNGKLGIAFGARGKGGKSAGGMGAAAHYEPGTKMINLTRSTGFGSLAHEWGHFLDNILTKNMSGFITNGSSYELKTISKEEVVHGTIFETPKSRGKGFDRYYYDENAKNKAYPWAKLDSGQTQPGETTPHYKLGWFDSGQKAECKIPMDKPFIKKAQAIADMASKDIRDKISKMDDDNFVKGIFLENMDYWASNEECFARSFECYVSDKLENNGRKNTYLASKKKTESEDALIAYPQGENRKEINKLFDEFFDTIRGSEDLKKAVSRYSRFIKNGKTIYVKGQTK